MPKQKKPNQKTFDLDKHFNGLSAAEDERLTLLMEECSEIIQVVGKIMRHGYESRHPSGGQTNRELLEMEIGDTMHIIERLTRANDLSRIYIDMWKNAKADRIGKYLHHQ